MEHKFIDCLDLKDFSSKLTKDLLSKKINGNLLLHYYLENNKTRESNIIISKMIEFDIDDLFNDFNSENLTALMLASMNGKITTVKKLLKSQRIDIFKENIEKRNSLYFSEKYENKEISILLESLK